MAKYDPLHAHLASAVGATVRLTFSEIGALVGGLPPSARRHRGWWANSVGTHVEAAAWLDAGFRVVEVDLGREVVVFGRAW